MNIYSTRSFKLLLIAFLSLVLICPSSIFAGWFTSFTDKPDPEFEKFKKSIVFVSSGKSPNRSRSLGTIVTDDNYVLAVSSSIIDEEEISVVLYDKSKLRASVVGQSEEFSLLKLQPFSSKQKKAVSSLRRLKVAFRDPEKGDELITYRKGLKRTVEVTRLMTDPWGQSILTTKKSAPIAAYGTPAINKHGELGGIFCNVNSSAGFEEIIPCSVITEFLSSRQNALKGPGEATKEYPSVRRPPFPEKPSSVKPTQPLKITPIPVGMRKALYTKVSNSTVVVHTRSAEKRGGMSVGDTSYGTVISPWGFIVAPDRDLMRGDNTQYIDHPDWKKPVTVTVVARNVEIDLVLLKPEHPIDLTGLSFGEFEDKNCLFISAEYFNTCTRIHPFNAGEKMFTKTARMIKGLGFIQDGGESMVVTNLLTSKKHWHHGVGALDNTGKCIGVFNYNRLAPASIIKRMAESVRD